MKQLNTSTISPTSTCSELLIDVVPLLMAVIRMEARRVQPPDLTSPQFRALAFIDRHDGMSLSAVSEVLGLTLSSVSKLMDGLVTLGYVRQETCPQDRRRAQLHATAMGRAKMVQARGEISERLTQRLSELAPDAMAEIMAGLQHLQGLLAPPQGGHTLSRIPNAD